jgi:hypothetical protein
MNSAVIALAINSICFFLLLKIVNNWTINPLAPVSLFNIGFFYSYFLSGFLLIYDIGNFTIYESIWKSPSVPLVIYFIPPWLGLISFNIGYLIRQSSKRSRNAISKIQYRHDRKRVVIPFILLSLSISSAFGILLSIYSIIY